MNVKLVSADSFEIDQLVSTYNSARTDYLVPMPMDKAGMVEYIRIFNIDLSQSLVALNDSHLAGLGLLGIRKNQSWITRLGLSAKMRGRGIGEKLVKGLLKNSDRLNIPVNTVEVIKDNQPARKLFRKLGFRAKRELVILRRPPKSGRRPNSTCIPLKHSEILRVIRQRTDTPTWINQSKTFTQLRNLDGFKIAQNKQICASVIYQVSSNHISRLVFNILKGELARPMQELLSHLHQRYPHHTVTVENIPVQNPHLPVFKNQGYHEVFRRIEMQRDI